LKCNQCGSDIPAYNSFCPTCGYQQVEEYDRLIFKKRARLALSNKYWYAFLVCLIESIIVGIFDYTERYGSEDGRFGSLEQFVDSPFLIALFSIIAAASLLALVYEIFIANSIRAGSSKYFINNHYAHGEIVDIFYAFRGRQYLRIVGAMAWRTLFTFLWTLLFIIPGIIKAYAYCLVPYILAENPDIGYDRALKLSMNMTNGFKGEIFVLQLSFLGWYLLGALCLGIGVLFVNPYFSATMAEMYISLRDNAIKRGICTYQELNLTPGSGPELI
jgi:uncharacterized membrane protein